MKNIYLIKVIRLSDDMYETGIIEWGLYDAKETAVNVMGEISQKIVADLKKANQYIDTPVSNETNIEIEGGWYSYSIILSTVDLNVMNTINTD